MDLEYNLEDIRQELESGNAFLIDVREQDEWDEDHLKHAQLHPLSTLNPHTLPKNLDEDKKIYIHCRRGGRAVEAATFFKGTYKEVIPLKCDFETLKKADF